MEKRGFIQIRVTDKKGGFSISPDIYDISEIRNIIDYTEKLLFPHDRKNRPSVSYEIKEGYVRHFFKTTFQAIIGFNALLGQIYNKKRIDFLEYQTAQAFATLQDTALKQNYSFYITTSVESSNHLTIDPGTDYVLPQEEWVEAEFYIYGDITNMGGKKKPNVHVSTPGLGSYIIDTPKEILADYENNPLYKPLGIRAFGRQNVITGELDYQSLRFREFIDYQPDYNEKYLNTLIDKAAESLADDINTDKWLRELRGGNY